MKPKFNLLGDLVFVLKNSPMIFIIFITTFLVYNCQKEEVIPDGVVNQLKSTSTEADDGYVTYYENELFTREAGKPVIFTRQIGNSSLAYDEGCLRLHIQSGINDQDFVSAAIVKIDGQEVLTASDFTNSNQSFQIDLCNLTETSVMELIIYGTPGSKLDVWIDGKPANSGTFADARDGHVYKWVRICDKIWMAENLAYLPSVNHPSEGSNTVPCYYVYDYQGTDVIEAKATLNYNNYGVLYNWAAAMQGAQSSNAIPSGVKGISPEGWHLPSDAEWDSMFECVGTGENPFFKLISGGSSGFNAVFSGIRGWDGLYWSMGLANYMWTSTNYNDDWAYASNIDNTVSIAYTDVAYKISGFAVRCVKD